MIAALTSGELSSAILIVGILVLLAAAYVAYVGRLAAAAVMAVIGLLLLFVGS